MNALGSQFTREVTALRRTLHRIPELANHESETAQLIARYVGEFRPDEIITQLGGAGVAAIYGGQRPGPTLLFRAELDALPIHETNDFDHHSRHGHVAHKCGHDGHMAMVAGLAPLLHASRPARGRVVLLFQPAEETGEGAAAILRDARFPAIAPDYAFALHNLPGWPLHRIVIRDGTFTMGSVGLSATLEGSTSHASQPERGRSPMRAIGLLLQELPALAVASDLTDFTLVTLTHLRAGEPSFGISPGRAELLATLRAAKDEDLQLIRGRAVDLVRRAAGESKLAWKVSWSDEFAATVNHPEAVNAIRSAAGHLGAATSNLPEPIRWSEDFGLFTQVSCGAMLGLGSGTDHAALHSPEYDFPDELIPTGIGLFRRIIAQLLD